MTEQIALDRRYIVAVYRRSERDDTLVFSFAPKGLMQERGPGGSPKRVPKFIASVRQATDGLAFDWSGTQDDPGADREEMEEGRMKYFDLNRLALTVTQPGGMLVTCSCSGLFSPEDFFNVLKGAARGARRRVQVLSQTGPGADHPVMTDCPESSYLKCLWCRVW